MLVYEQDFTVSTYKKRAEAEERYFPCSWYRENNQVIPYEFSDKDLVYDIVVLTANLNFLESQGYLHYGTAVRPILNVNEFETKNGHVYEPVDEIKTGL